MRSNCVAFACALYWRRRAKGREGYLLFRRSRMGPFFHALYAEERKTGGLRVVSFSTGLGKPGRHSTRLRKVSGLMPRRSAICLRSSMGVSAFGARCGGGVGHNVHGQLPQLRRASCKAFAESL